MALWNLKRLDSRRCHVSVWVRQGQFVLEQKLWHRKHCVYNRQMSTFLQSYKNWLPQARSFHMVNFSCFIHFQLWYSRVNEICQSCQTWPAKFGKILLRADTRLVFCNWKLMRTDMLFTRTANLICNFVNPEILVPYFYNNIEDMHQCTHERMYMNIKSPWTNQYFE